MIDLAATSRASLVENATDLTVAEGAVAAIAL